MARSVLGDLEVTVTATYRGVPLTRPAYESEDATIMRIAMLFGPCHLPKGASEEQIFAAALQFYDEFKAKQKTLCLASPPPKPPLYERLLGARGIPLPASQRGA